jgi:hypothetical protein
MTKAESTTVEPGGNDDASSKKVDATCSMRAGVRFHESQLSSSPSASLALRVAE